MAKANLVSADDDGVLCFVATGARKLSKIVRRAHASIAGCLALSPLHSHGLVLASGGFDSSISFWYARYARLCTIG
jgi:hypothetical protein